LLIHAVASGKAVARTLYQKFSGKTLSPRDVELHLPLVRYTRGSLRSWVERHRLAFAIIRWPHPTQTYFLAATTPARIHDALAQVTELRD